MAGIVMGCESLVATPFRSQQKSLMGLPPLGSSAALGSSGTCVFLAASVPLTQEVAFPKVAAAPIDTHVASFRNFRRVRASIRMRASHLKFSAFILWSTDNIHPADSMQSAYHAGFSSRLDQPSAHRGGQV